jgi:hypothetical protein
MEQQHLQFHVAEYGLARQELVWNYNAAYNMLIYSLAANSFIMTWVSSELKKPERLSSMLCVAALLPLMVSVVAWTMYAIRRRNIQIIGQYLMNLERKLAMDGFGLSSFYKEKREKGFRSSNVFHLLFLVQMTLAGGFAAYADRLTR